VGGLSSLLLLVYARDKTRPFGEQSQAIVIAVAVLFQAIPLLYVGKLVVHYFSYAGEVRESSKDKAFTAVLISVVNFCLFAAILFASFM
jgi:hypothetical protein